MKLLRVTYALAIPEEVTEAEAESWLRYRLGLNYLTAGHPLEDKDEAGQLIPGSQMIPGSLSCKIYNASMVWPA